MFRVMSTVVGKNSEKGSVSVIFVAIPQQLDRDANLVFLLHNQLPKSIADVSLRAELEKRFGVHFEIEMVVSQDKLEALMNFLTERWGFESRYDVVSKYTFDTLTIIGMVMMSVMGR